MLKKLGASAVVAALLAVTIGTVASAQDGQEPIEIYVLQPAPSDPYPRESEGIMAELEKHDNVNVTLDYGTAQTDAATMITKMNDAVTRGVDVILVNSGAVGEQLVLPAEEAIAKGVEIVTFDQDVPAEGRKSYIQWDASDAGTMAGQYFREQVLAEYPDGGPIGMIIAFKGNPLLGSIDDGFKAEIEGTGLEIVTEIDTAGDPNDSRAATEDILLANPDLVGLFVDNDLATIGVRPALEARGEKPFMMGVFGTPEAFEEIANDGWQDATVACPFQALGAVGLKTAIAVANGEEVPELQSLPSLLVTPENAGSAIDEIMALAGE